MRIEIKLGGGSPEAKRGYKVFIPHDIAERFKEASGAEDKEGMKRVFRFMVALADSLIPKALNSQNGQIIFREGDSEQLIYDCSTRSFGEGHTPSSFEGEEQS